MAYECHSTPAISYRQPVASKPTVDEQCMAALHCCKGDYPFQWKMANFEPLFTPTPLIYQYQNWHNDSAIPLAVENSL